MVKGAYEKYYTEMSPEALLKKEHLEPDEEAVIDSMADEAAEQFLQKHARNPRIRDRAAGKLAKRLFIDKNKSNNQASLLDANQVFGYEG